MNNIKTCPMCKTILTVCEYQGTIAYRCEQITYQSAQYSCTGVATRTITYHPHYTTEYRKTGEHYHTKIIAFPYIITSFMGETRISTFQEQTHPFGIRDTTILTVPMMDLDNFNDPNKIVDRIKNLILFS